MSVATRSSGRREGRGYILILVALLLPVLFGILAMVIDLGFAMSTHRLMQSAADAAAIEGLRHQDAQADNIRRMYARQRMLQMFDDDMEPASHTYDPALDGPIFDAFPFGAGPIIRLGPGQTNLNAQQTLDTSALGIDSGLDATGHDTGGVYNPFLQLNLSNAAHGDMIAGSYDPAQSHVEGDNYLRSDLSPGSNAFLVRLRRVRDANVLDNIAGISSSGPTLPLLLGRGSMMQAADPAAGYSPRHHGVNVRTTSIAHGQPAMVVGPTLPADLFGPGVPAATIEGVEPFTFNFTQMVNQNVLLSPGDTLDVTWNAGGNLVFDPGGGNVTIGRSSRAWTVNNVPNLGIGDVTLVVENSNNALAPPFLIRINNEIMEVTAIAHPNWTVVRAQRNSTEAVHARRDTVYLFGNVSLGELYVNTQRPANALGRNIRIVNLAPPNRAIMPLYRGLGGGSGTRVIGFGLFSIEATNPNATTLRITRQAGEIIPVNASAVLADNTSITGFASAQMNNLFQYRRTLNDAALAPASAGVYGP